MASALARANELVRRAALPEASAAWVTPAELPSPLADALMTADVGELVGPVRVSDGFELARLVERRGEQVPRLDDDLRDSIAADRPLSNDEPSPERIEQTIDRSLRLRAERLQTRVQSGRCTETEPPGSAPFPVAALQWTGNDDVPAEELRGAVNAAVGGTGTIRLDPNGDLPAIVYDAARDVLAEHGFLNGRIHFDWADCTLGQPRADQLVVEVRESTRYRVSGTEVREMDAQGDPVGPTRVAAVAARQPLLRPGDWYSRSRAEQDRREVLALYLAAGWRPARVVLDPEEQRGGRVRVVILVVAPAQER